MPPLWDLHYDRRVSDAFLAWFMPGGAAERLVEYAKYAAYPIDLQMRRNPKTGAEHASLYVGLTTVLDVHRKKTGLALTAHPSYTGGGFGFHEHWTSPMDHDALSTVWRKVENYVECVVPAASAKNAGDEGPVQSAASVFSGRDRTMVDREVALHFKDKATKDQIMKDVTSPFVASVASMTKTAPPGKRPTSFGGECDLLALDSQGRLLAVEVKPKDVATIGWAPAQATVYARLLERWVQQAPVGTDRPATVLRGMLDQRARLGLAPYERPGLQEVPPVVPVVAIQRGVRQQLLDRLLGCRHTSLPRVAAILRWRSTRCRSPGGSTGSPSPTSAAPLPTARRPVR